MVVHRPVYVELQKIFLNFPNSQRYSICIRIIFCLPVQSINNKRDVYLFLHFEAPLHTLVYSSMTFLIMNEVNQYLSCCAFAYYHNFKLDCRIWCKATTGYIISFSILRPSLEEALNKKIG